MGERRVRGRIGDVVRGYVDRLHRGDGATFERCDPLLEEAHLVGQVRLVTDLEGIRPEQGGDLRSGLGETEDVVDEQQHVLTLDVTEVLGDGQRGQATRRRTPGGSSIWPNTRRRLLDDAGLLHLEEEIGALTGPLADAGEHRDAAVLVGDPVDHLLDEDRLADACAPEQPDLPTLEVGADQIEDLDPGLEHRLLRLDVLEGGGWRMDRPAGVGEVLSGASSESPHTLKIWPRVWSPTGTVIGPRC